jgi:hypothetical protein
MNCNTLWISLTLLQNVQKFHHSVQKNTLFIPVVVDNMKITGQLDDAAGVGICLYIAHLSREGKFPPLLLLFSEMEEHGPYVNPYRGIVPGLGAARISQHLLSLKKIPALLLTIDTTPFYKGNNGISLYSRFWEKCKFQPSGKLLEFTEKLEDYFLTQFPGIQHQNNTNDYITYGRFFNAERGYAVPSIALEPAIYPYHTKGEGVFISDIQQVVTILTTFLTQFPFHLIGPIL